MSLLPLAMRIRDALPALGRKVETPVAPKLDPIEAFNKGDHALVIGEISRCTIVVSPRVDPKSVFIAYDPTAGEDATAIAVEIRGQVTDMLINPTIRSPAQVKGSTATEIEAGMRGTEICLAVAQEIARLRKVAVERGIRVPNSHELRRRAGVADRSKATVSQMGYMLAIVQQAVNE